MKMTGLVVQDKKSTYFLLFNVFKFVVKILMHKVMILFYECSALQ